MPGTGSSRVKTPRFPERRLPADDRRRRLALAELCQINKLYRAYASLSADAFVADPRLADDLESGDRYNASRAAVGLGGDAANLDEAEKVRLRTQALDWLRADLVLWSRLLEGGLPADRATVRQTLSHCHLDGDLTGIRDEIMLAKLPPEEREAHTELWMDVATLLEKATNHTDEPQTSTGESIPRKP